MKKVALASTIRDIVNGRSRARRTAVGAAVNYTLERLECRLLLTTTNSWAAVGGGDWDVASNWALGHVPTAGEDAVINLPASDTVTFSDNDSDSVNSITSTASLNLTKGTLTVAGNVQVSGTLSLNGATLAGATIAGNTTLSGGSNSFTNTVFDGITIAAGSTLDLSGGGNFTFVDGLMINGTLAIGSATNANVSSYLQFQNSQTL
jgi:hypothetical protein